MKTKSSVRGALGALGIAAAVMTVSACETAQVSRVATGLPKKTPTITAKPRRTTTTAPTTTAPTTTTSAAPTSASFPFSGTPWKRPVRADAIFEAATAPRTANLLKPNPGGWAPGINIGKYSHPVYVATANDPLATWTWTGTGQQFSFRCPASATPAAGTDRHMHCVQPDGVTVYEMWLADPTTHTAGYIVRTSLTSSGVGAGGVRAYGGSALGGLIRVADVQAGVIAHPLAIALTGDQLRVGPVWPATSQDGNAASTYTGLNPMGTFVAIPKSVNLSALGLNGPTLMVAKALQDYGGYVVDRSGSWVLYGEPGISSTWSDQVWPNIDKLRQQLRVVTNNSP